MEEDLHILIIAKNRDCVTQTFLNAKPVIAKFRAEICKIAKGAGAEVIVGIGIEQFGSLSAFYAFSYSRSVDPVLLSHISNRKLSVPLLW
ncbi:hypothetical protein DICA0_E26082 [Diutina catenulata]